MKEVKGDLWSFFGNPDYKVFITTNGSIKQNGQAVLGRGCAKEAKDRLPELAIYLGEQLKKFPEAPPVMWFERFQIGVFPVKYHFWKQADLKLIENSAKKLAEIVTKLNWTNIVLPRPGCGNGKLEWEGQVKPILAKYFDDRFIIVNR